MRHEIQDTLWNTLKKVHQPGAGIQKPEQQISSRETKKMGKCIKLKIRHELIDHSHKN